MGTLLARVSVPRRLELAALLVYGIVFALVLAFGRPGLGVSQGFYLPIVLVALAGGPVSGVGAGILATLLCGVASSARGDISGGAMFDPLLVRFAAFTAAGLAVGYFAGRGRKMLAESLELLEEVMRLARREVATGALTSEGIQARISDRLEWPRPFAVLVGEMDARSETAQRDLMRRLAALAPPESDIAHVGRSRVALVTPSESPEEAGRAALALEDALGVRFGWAFRPHDGDDPLSLFGVASERL
jgi:hypothetical protein